MVNLIEKAIRTLNNNQIEEIWRAGIRRDSLTYHSTVMYPPLKAMSAINAQQIYTHFQNKNRDFTLYVHIPFCSGKCTFCYFYQLENPSNETITRYLDALKKEIAITGTKITSQLGPLAIKSVFFGGGSPTFLSTVQFGDLITAIKRQFSISDKIEITVEIHPEIMKRNGRALLEYYFNNNINRLNIGVQSFDDNILRITNRRHTAKEGIEIFKQARAIGFKNINIDLLYPLPDLTPEIWERTLTTAFDLEPESVTTYFTAIREPSSMFGLFHQHPDRFPNEYINHLFRIMAIEKAKEKGYNHRKLIDWFVKPRDDFHYDHQKSEVKQTEKIQLLSFGSGVFSYINYVQFYNYPNLQKYCEMIEAGALPIWKGIKLTKEERLARAMVLGIKSGDVNVKEIETRFKINIMKKYDPLLKKIKHLGLIENKNGSICLSERGMLFADEVAVQFATKNIRNKLAEEPSAASKSEHDLIESYNFMYDINGLNFLR
jgi:oxygen-independent coproporphyrinogen III oxidase